MQFYFLGFLLCTIALVVRILHSTFIIQYSDSDVDPILNYESTIWYIGACMGSLFCGFKRHIWSIRLTNVKCFYLKMFCFKKNYQIFLLSVYHWMHFIGSTRWISATFCQIFSTVS